MVKRPAQQEDGGSNPTPALQKMHDAAGERFKADPSKCYQRHIRELYAETESRKQLPSLSGARVRVITNLEAAAIILKYEWLRTMASGTCRCYGLFLNGELIGASCLNRGRGPENRNICGPEHARYAVSLARGACVPWAPPNAASFLIRWTCRLAHKEKGWKIFFAYSDAMAGEIGTVYQAAGWKYIGIVRAGHKGKNLYHSEYMSPDGTRKLTNSQLASRRVALAKELGINPHPFRKNLRDAGWKQIKVPDKARYVWFEGPEKQELENLCKYPFLPYPKRSKLL